MSEDQPPLVGGVAQALQSFLVRGNLWALEGRAGDKWAWQFGQLDGQLGTIEWLGSLEVGEAGQAVLIALAPIVGITVTTCSEEALGELKAVARGLAEDGIDFALRGQSYYLKPASSRAWLETFLPLVRVTPPHRRIPPTADVCRDGYFHVPSSPPLIALVRAVQDAHEGAHGWSDNQGATVPIYRHAVGRGREGVVEVSVRADEGNLSAQDPILATLWDQVRGLQDLTADVLLTALAQWLGAGDGGSVWIRVDDILQYRGIRPMTKREGEVSRRAGAVA